MQITSDQILSLALALAPYAIPVLFMVGTLVWGQRFKDRQLLVTQLIGIAYRATDEAARLTPNGVDDKVAHALGSIHRLLESNGKAPLKPGEVELAKARFSAMHAEEKAMEAKLSMALPTAPGRPALPPP